MKCKVVNEVKGALVRVQNNNVYEGKLWIGIAGDSDDVWKQHVF